jgi:two-component system response regulator DevR
MDSPTIPASAPIAQAPRAGGDRPITLVLVDDHRMVRQALTEVFDAHRDFEVLGSTDRAGAAIELITSTRPDVAVLDVRLPELSGIELCAAICRTMPSPACLMLTAFDDRATVRDAVRAGASGFVRKTASTTELFNAIVNVAAGRPAFDAEVTAGLIDDLRHPELRRASPLDALSATEREILDLLSAGLTNRDIADHVHLAESTVKSHVSAILRKLEVTSRTEAAVLAMRAHQRGG